MRLSSPKKKLLARGVSTQNSRLTCRLIKCCCEQINLGLVCNYVVRCATLTAVNMLKTLITHELRQLRLACVCTSAHHRQIKRAVRVLS